MDRGQSVGRRAIESVIAMLCIVVGLAWIASILWFIGLGIAYLPNGGLRGAAAGLFFTLLELGVALFLSMRIRSAKNRFISPWTLVLVALALFLFIPFNFYFWALAAFG